MKTATLPVHLPANTRHDDLHAALREFVYFETRLLDERRFEDWYTLFDEDGVYWIPASASADAPLPATLTERCADRQETRQTQAALALENRMLLKLRIARMQHAQAHSLHPTVRGLHVIQRPEVLDHAVLALPPDMHAVACNLMYMERQGEHQVTLGGSARYLLRDHGRQWRIVEKRVLLLGGDSFLPAIQLFI